MLQQEGSSGISPTKIIEVMRLLPRPFWANMKLLGGRTTEFHMYELQMLILKGEDPGG